MDSERLHRKAERLRVLIAAIGEEPTMTMADTFALRLVPGGWGEYMNEEVPTEEMKAEIHLAFECAGIARDIRLRQWRALERADALVSAGDGGALPPPEQGALARALLELGWDSIPEED
jgi:hypothetical protein